MKMSFFGDSYDIVKQSLLRWLADVGEWSAHPMFTEAATSQEAADFARFLGVPVISSEVLRPETKRDGYFRVVERVEDIFLDPDTGVCLTKKPRAKSHRYVYASELVHMAAHPGSRLILTFDQSYRRGAGAAAVAAKLEALQALGLYGFGYVSHSCFLILGCDPDRVEAARSNILSKSHLPPNRIVIRS